MSARARAAFILLFALTACRTARNYLEPDQPRYADARFLAAPAGHEGPLHVGSFNIQYARKMDEALAVIDANEELRKADILLLQEMDEAGTRRVAEALSMAYVYYPGAFRFRTQRDFGNAVLSRWPIVEDAKILLPHRGLLGGTQRIATAATIRVGTRTVRVYSAHLGTPVNIDDTSRREQLRTIFADAKPYEHVLIGGDMNSHVIGKTAREAGYLWPTEKGPRTLRFGRWDHIFLRGLIPGETGTVLDVQGASDHRPIWAVVALP